MVGMASMAGMGGIVRGIAWAQWDGVSMCNGGREAGAGFDV
jgi:hypothetical protein